MKGAVRLLVLSVLTVLQQQHHVVNGFGIPAADTFHAMQTAASHAHVMQTAASHFFHGTSSAATTTLPHHVDLLEAYKHTLSAHPLPTKMITGATLAVCGDAIAQTKDKPQDVSFGEHYDKRRASSFAIFDMSYRALQHFSFPIIVAACHGQYLGSLPVLGDHLDVSQLAAIEQTLASQLGIVPFLYYPAFFALTGAIQGLSVKGAISRAQENFVPLMKRNLLFWLPVQFIQFGYIQEDLQIPFLSVCGLAWTFILSIMAGSAKQYTPEKELEQVAIQSSSSLNNEDNDAIVVPSSVLGGRPANATSY